MPILAAIHYMIFVALFLAGAAGLAIYATIALPGWLRRRQLEAQHPTPPPLTDGSEPDPLAPAGGQSDWVDGEDLLRYPQRLAELEAQLGAAHDEARQQVEHLRGRRDRIAAKEGRTELLQRYDHDAEMLNKRADNMRRVMALVWRTRAILVLRAHVAISARRRPNLERIPEGEVTVEHLRAAAEAYERAADEVRRFVTALESRLADLSVAVPSPHRGAELQDEDRAAVDQEMEGARETYAELQNQMDRLADTLAYMADRCRTRQVVEGATVTLDGGPGTDGLLAEVGDALSALNDLSRLADEQLADTAMDNLAEDISHLERAGLDAQAAAEAELEIARLLEQFPT